MKTKFSIGYKTNSEIKILKKLRYLELKSFLKVNDLYKEKGEFRKNIINYK